MWIQLNRQDHDLKILLLQLHFVVLVNQSLDVAAHLIELFVKEGELISVVIGDHASELPRPHLIDHMDRTVNLPVNIAGNHIGGDRRQKQENHHDSDDIAP